MSCKMEITVGNYALSLTGDVFNRYLEKISPIGFDPYVIHDSEFSEEHPLPELTLIDVINYLVKKTSYYSDEQFKAYKSLDAYNFFICKWIKEVRYIWTTEPSRKCVVVGKVWHSQRLSEKYTSCWVILDVNGAIGSAHCDCMAGLGEACSHIGSILFHLEDKIRNEEKKACTDVAAYWKIPGNLKKVEYKPIKDINFTPAKKMFLNQRKYSCKLKDKEKDVLETPCKKPVLESNQAIENVNLDSFLGKLLEVNPNAGILTVSKNYQEKFSSVINEKRNSSHERGTCAEQFLKNVIEKEKVACGSYASEKETGYQSNSIVNLKSIYCENHLKCSYEELLVMADKLNLYLTENDIKYIEKLTKKQRDCSEWYSFRAGRITASVIKDVCHVRSAFSNFSLIQKICNPGKKKFKSASIEYGIRNEKKALEHFYCIYSRDHKNLTIAESGFVIDIDFPFIGASPDGIIYCECCGKGTLEIKCPSSIEQTCDLDSLSYLNVRTDGTRYLDRSYGYYYQIVTQMHVLKFKYAVFFVWTPMKERYHVERFVSDDELWKKIVNKSEQFFKSSIIPELLAEYVSRTKKKENDNNKENNPNYSTNSIKICSKRPVLRALNLN